MSYLTSGENEKRGGSYGYAGCRGPEDYQDDNDRCINMLLSGQAEKSELKVEPNLLVQFLLRLCEPPANLSSASEAQQKFHQENENFRTPAIRIVGEIFIFHNVLSQWNWI